MHHFICKAVQGNIVPEQSNKIGLFKKLINSYEEQNIRFKVTIEIPQKKINENQEGLYNAFILTASSHFGNTFQQMEIALKRFYPLNSFHARDYKPIDKWTSKELTDFIDKASACLLEADSDFKF